MDIAAILQLLLQFLPLIINKKKDVRQGACMRRAVRWQALADSPAVTDPILKAVFAEISDLYACAGASEEEDLPKILETAQGAIASCQAILNAKGGVA